MIAEKIQQIFSDKYKSAHFSKLMNGDNTVNIRLFFQIDWAIGPPVRRIVDPIALSTYGKIVNPLISETYGKFLGPSNG